MTYPITPTFNHPAGTTADALKNYFDACEAWGNSIVGGGGTYYVFLDTRSAPQTYTLPDPLVTPIVSIKDKYGNAFINNITVYGHGVSLIDGNPTFVMNQNFECIIFAWNGDSHSVC